jgi:hypothetical protein
MSTLTSRLRLYKPAADGSENVNVVSDLNDNWDRLDAMVSFVPVTSVTYPASAYQGEAFYETDTGEAYINKSAVPSASDYYQILTAGADFHDNISLGSSAYQVNIGGNADTTAKFTALVPSGTDLLTGRIISASAFNSFYLEANGSMGWGPGTSTQDVRVSRSAVGTLEVDGALQVVGEFDAFADANVGGDLSVSGEIIANTSAIMRPELHVATTISNSSAEAVLQSFAIPADDAVVGAVYRIRAYGTAQVTGTPTMTFRFRIGGVAGTSLLAFSAITARTGMTDGFWEIELIATCSATGVSGTWSPFGRGGHNFVGTASTLTSMLTAVTASVTRDTTISNDLVLTGQWSAASSSNSIVCRGSLCERIA